MTIASEITRLQWAKADIKTAIENKWVTVWNITLDNYSACIDAIPTWSDVAVVDFLLLWWWGGWGGNCITHWWWGGAWWVIIWKNYALSKGSYNVTIWSWWTNAWNWGNSCFEGYVALWWWGGGTWCRTNCAWKNWASWGWAWWKIPTVWIAQQCLYVHGGWFWGDWCCCSSGYGWDGGIWYLTSMTWHEECFAWWWGGSNWWHWMYWWWNSQSNASTCGSWWWGSNNGNYYYRWWWWALIISYPSDCGYNISWANCSCVCNWVCVHCFTSNWTLTVN